MGDSRPQKAREGAHRTELDANDGVASTAFYCSADRHLIMAHAIEIAGVQKIDSGVCPIGDVFGVKARLEGLFGAADVGLQGREAGPIRWALGARRPSSDADAGE
jgi:hypothetical protein